MATNYIIRAASRVISGGGVVAYPTEGVFGLGCLPDDFDAVSRILQIKSRDPAMGLVLIVAELRQLDGWIRLPPGVQSLPSSDAHPVTWIVPATEEVPWWIRGEHAGVAVRQTTHRTARALCERSGSALVSTSANVSGRRPAANQFQLRRQFGSLVDYLVPGACGPAAGPSEIRDLQSGTTMRPA